MLLSPLQKRIVELSSKILSADLEEFNRTASELKAALREHVESLRKVVDETKQRLIKSAAAAQGPGGPSGETP